jgi:hypothetical protein
MIGGKKTLKHIYKNLRYASMTVPEFISNSMKESITTNELLGSSEFSFAKYQEIRELSIAKITSKLGWPARNRFRDNTLEYYQVHRQIIFAKNMALLRNYIVIEMNKLIHNRIGSYAITINGLPNYEDICKIQQDLISAKITLEEAYNKIQL